jgi:hypothetical protein
VQYHDLVWPQAEGLVGVPFPITELDLKRSAASQNLDHCPYLTTPEIVLREINGQRHDIKEFDWD